MAEKIRILFLSANPWTTSRIMVDEEAREIFERIQEGPHRECFELNKHAAIRPIDLQRLLLMYEPHIVHFSGHGSKSQKLILGGAPGRGKEVDRQGLSDIFALYKDHLRLVVLNACFTKEQARSISEAVDYSIGTGKGMGDKAGVAFAGAFYRALAFGKSIKQAFDSAKAELGLTRMPRTQGLELFVREGVGENDLVFKPSKADPAKYSAKGSPPRASNEAGSAYARSEHTHEPEITLMRTSEFSRVTRSTRSSVSVTTFQCLMQSSITKSCAVFWANHRE